MIKWIKNSKSKKAYKNSKRGTGYKGITLTHVNKYEARLDVSIKDKWHPIYIGTYKTLEEAKKARIDFILSLL